MKQAKLYSPQKNILREEDELHYLKTQKSKDDFRLTQLWAGNETNTVSWGHGRKRKKQKTNPVTIVKNEAQP